MTSVIVTPVETTVPKGIRTQFTAIGTLSNGLHTDLTDRVTWTAASAGLGSADIDSGGLATATGVGHVVITATHAESGVSASALLTVTSAALQAITVTPDNSSLPAGLSRQFVATGHFDDASGHVLLNLATWSTGSAGDTGSASIDSVSGHATAVSEGTVTVRASYSGFTGSTVLTVIPAVLVRLSVSPGDVSVPQGDTQQFTVTGTLSDRSQLDVSSSVTWDIGAGGDGRATISESGLATAIGVGVVTIVATHESGLRDTATLNVLPGVIPVEIDILPGSEANRVHVDGKGVIPVAVLGSDHFDVRLVDPDSLCFAGLEIRGQGNGRPSCSVEDVDGDGFDDLVCHFVDDAGRWSPGDDGTATLTGRLSDGTPFEGAGSVRD